MSVLPGDAKKGDGGRGEERVGGGGALFKKQEKKGVGVKRGADRRRRFRVEVRGGRLAPWLGPVCGERGRGAELKGEKGGARGREGRS